MTLSEHVYCVAVTVKMTEWIEQQICIKFCIKLEHSSAAMGNWWLEASSWQSACSCITSCGRFLAKKQVTQVTQPPYSPDLASCDFCFFPKLRSPLKGKRFQTVNEIQENITGWLMVTGRTVWVPKVPTLKGSEASLSHVELFFVSCILG